MVALLVRADQLAEPPRPQLRAKRLAVPPGENFEEKQFHQAVPVGAGSSKTLMPSARLIVQLDRRSRRSRFARPQRSIS
jgi:hypothetical protein